MDKEVIRNVLSSFIMRIATRIVRTVLLFLAFALGTAACSSGAQAGPTAAAGQNQPTRARSATSAPASPIYGQLGAVGGPTVDTTALAGNATQVALLSTAVGSPAGPTTTFGSVILPGQTQQPTASPTATLTPSPSGTAGPTSAWGPVIGPNYTPPPPPTSVPPATMLPAGTLPPVATAGPSPTPGPLLHSNLMGIQIHGFLTDVQFSGMLDRAAELGVGWIKVQIDWSLHEPAKGQFSIEYQTKVLNVQRASIRGFRTLLSIAKAPDWARPASVRGHQDDGPPENPQDFADFVARLVRDIKPEFIDAIEIWNEPNLIREWRGKPINGAEYMKLFRAGYQAILNEEAAQPSALRPGHRITIISAGPAPVITFPDGSTMGDREWLQQLYNSGLASIGPDVVVGAHPYGWANPPEALCCQASPGVTGWYEHQSFYFRETLSGYRDLMVRNGHAGAKLWVTEFGWATYDGLKRSDGNPASVNGAQGWQTLIDQQQQADYVVRAFAMAQQPPFYDYVGPMMLWNLNFSLVGGMIDQGREEAGFALLDGQGNPRPVFVALRNAPKTPN